MTCKDCIHLQPNTEHCNEYDIEVDVKPYRICAKMEVNEDFKPYPPYVIHDRASGGVIDIAITADDDICPDFEPIDNSWESVSK